MDLVLDVLITLISLVFLSIVGVVAGVAIPGMFLTALAPWLERLIAFRKRS